MTAQRKRRLRTMSRPLRCLAVALALVAVEAYGAEPPRAASATSPLLVPARPYWPELTVAQRQALAPLTEDWERLDVQTKKKWVEIANRYPKMRPDEQARTSERMREWALLTPEQRRVARDSFARIRAMPPEQRAEILRKYQELPPERKQALTTEGQATKPLVVPKQMAAPAQVPRRTQIREGAKVGNPAVAAQKSASPMAAPPHVDQSRPPAPASPPSPAAPPAAAPATPPS
jgi:hypothetical protein